MHFPLVKIYRMTRQVNSTHHHVNVYKAKRNKTEFTNMRQKCAVTEEESFCFAAFVVLVGKKIAVFPVIPTASPQIKSGSIHAVYSFCH